jgi:hypothetical protein
MTAGLVGSSAGGLGVLDRGFIVTLALVIIANRTPVRNIDARRAHPG